MHFYFFPQFTLLKKLSHSGFSPRAEKKTGVFVQALDKIEQKVSKIYEIDRADLYIKSRQRTRADARSVLFYWAVRELGIEGTYLAKIFGMSQPGVVYAVNKGEKIVRQNNLNLIE